MSALAASVFLLAAGGIYLALGRRRFEVILGLSLLAHAANLVVLSGTARSGSSPALHELGTAVETMADPLPQAMVLTAIVISMAMTLYLLALLVAAGRTGNGGKEERPRERGTKGGKEE